MAVCLAGLGLTAAPAAEKALKRDQNKEFDQLTPSEHIAIRAAAKAAYKAKKLKVLNVCADPGNMPLSNIKQEGFQNKLAKLLAESMGARLNYHWQPFIERGLTRSTFDEGYCDVMFDIPTGYGRLLTTLPIYKTPYVLVYRNDKGLNLTGLDDPKLKDLKIGVFQTSGIRIALAKRGIANNVELQTQTHDADIVLENQPWYVIQRVLDGELDVAAVFGPFAGWRTAMKNEPLTILPVNLQDDRVPLEFELGLGVRNTDAFLKYMLDFALEDKAEQVATLLKEYGVPLVQCSKCIVAGDLPAHGSYTMPAQSEYKARPDLATPDQVVTKEKVEKWLEEGADINQELSNAIIAGDPERIKFLLIKGADINAPDTQGWTPLTSAARQRKDNIIALLIENGAKPNIVDGNGMTPLIAAAMRDHVPSVKLLLEKGANAEEPGPEGFHPLNIAIAEQRYEVAKALMEGGADVSAASGIDGLTPLMLVAAQMAAAEGAMFVPGSTRPIDVAKGLVDRGANVNAQAKNGTTALMVAATHNNPPMIGLLMEAGADPELKNKSGQTARGVAQLNGNAEAAQAILVLGSAKAASVPKPEGDDKTPTPQ